MKENKLNKLKLNLALHKEQKCQKEDLLTFIDKEVSLIDAKAEKAKARAAEKKAEEML